MKREGPYWWIVLIFWPLLGGAWGAWVLFRGPYSRLSHINTDTFAPVFVWAFAVFFALVGLIAGAAICALIGGLVEWLRRRFGIASIAAIGVATLVNVLTLGQIGDFLQAKYPGLRAESATKQHRSNAPGKFAPADKGSYRNPCIEPPPTDTKERAIWDAECR
jgi:hypothetical protein